MRRPLKISTRTTPKSWTFGIFVAAVMLVLLQPLFGVTWWLVAGCVFVSFAVDGALGKISSTEVYID